MTPACHNRPEFIAYEHPSGELIQHRMSQPCKAWSVPDGTMPVPWMERWTAHCLKCMWFPKDDYRRFVNSTLGGLGS